MRNKTNTQANNLTDTDNGRVVTRGEGGWGKVERIKGLKIYGAGRRPDLAGEHAVEYTGAVL